MRKGRLAAVGSVIALGGVAGVVGASASPVLGIRPPACRNLKGDTVVLSTRQVTVYRGAARGRFGAHDWVCGRSVRRATALGAQLGGLGFPAHETIGPIVSAGPWVAAYESSRSGFVACPRSAPMPCPVSHHQVELIDAHSGGSGTSAVGARRAALWISSMRRPDGTRIGAVVWLQRLRGSTFRLGSNVDVIRAHSGEGIAGTVAQGRIAPGSVRLTGLRLRFVVNGHRRSVRLTTH